MLAMEDKPTSRDQTLLKQTRVLVELAKSDASRQSLDAAFERITRAAAETLGTERVSIWLYDTDRSAIRCADLYELGARCHSKGSELRAADFPAYFAALETERTIAAHDARSDPRTREFTASYLDPLGIVSMLDAPVRAGGRMIGVVCHEHVGAPRRWTEDEQRFAGSIADAASLVIEENERQAARAEAEAANRTKDEFLATVSHELRNPLNAMLGWVHLLRSGTLDKETMERALETIERNIQAQARIIDDILDVSRIVRGSLTLNVRPVDLAAVLHDVAESLSPAAQAKGIAVHTVLEPTEERLAGDPDRLRQVAWNLLSNAIKFTPRGGEVMVRLSREGSDFRLEVADTGEGIEAEFLPHVFEQFRQENGAITRVHGGLGLGLSIVRHLVELHGGSVAVESDGRDRGSRFTVTLPAAPPGC